MSRRNHRLWPAGIVIAAWLAICSNATAAETPIELVGDPIESGQPGLRIPFPSKTTQVLDMDNLWWVVTDEKGQEHRVKKLRVVWDNGLQEVMLQPRHSGLRLRNLVMQLQEPDKEGPRAHPAVPIHEKWETRLYPERREVDGQLRAPKPDSKREKADVSLSDNDFSVSDALTDLTELVEKGKLDPIIGRQMEIQRAVTILGRRKKNTPIFNGKPGVGKSAVAEGVALHLHHNKPEGFEDTRVWSLDVSALIAGAMLRGDVEKRWKQVWRAIERSPVPIVLFADEVHTIAHAGNSQGNPNGNLGEQMKPLLEKGKLKLMGTTDRWRDLTQDRALKRRLEKIDTEEPSIRETRAILQGLRPVLESFHGVKITDAALKAALHASDHDSSNRPDGPITYLDTAASHVAHNTNKRTVSAKDVALVFKQATGIPLFDDQAFRRRVIRLPKVLGDRVLGQPHAVAATSDVFALQQGGHNDPNRPYGSLLFVGPTGVGKTELTLGLAVGLFDDENALTRLNMSEFGERGSVRRLIGGASYSEPGILTEKVRNRPFSVLLLDEMEKAHPDVFNLLLQVMDAGQLADGTGEMVDFRHTVIVMTTNAGAQWQSGMGFSADLNGYDANEVIEKAGKVFPDEFMNRIDETIAFNQLTPEVVRRIVGLKLKGLNKRLKANKGLTIDTDSTVEEALARWGFNERMGARPLDRTIRQMISKPMARDQLFNTYRRGDRVRVELEGNGLALTQYNPKRQLSRRIGPRGRVASGR